MGEEPKVETLAETESFVIWMSTDPETGEPVYHIEYANVTIHFFEDEWEEFSSLMMQAMR